ncbi:AEC family transporter [Novosphingobium flavum]|uniref:AEC family transporter n=1 Tax=Novosphingobium flavum TaxID=1778672 RepID=A0A7X1FT55_9SPHN|nr:AEC family transporter [Novosphingobium flavum]MBC2665887.1 AEC family transporter [Novosphingobium flavum]
MNGSSGLANLHALLAMAGVVAPIFLLIALGFALGRARVFSPEQVRGFGRFVLLVALPALLVSVLARADMSRVLRPDYLLVYTLASLVSFGLGLAWFRTAARTDLPTAAVRAMGMSCSNSAFIGLPVATMVFGAAGAGPFALNTIIENLLMWPVVLILIEVGQSGEHHPGRVVLSVAKNLVRSPMLVGIVIGAGISLSGVHLPEFASRTLGVVAGASAPLALFTIGASLAGVSLHGRRAAIGAIALGKLALHPLLVVLALMVVPIGDPVFRSAAVLLAAVPMLSSFPVLAQRTGDEATCSAALLVTTVISFFTLLVTMALLGLNLA